MFVPQSAVLENPISPTRFSTFPEVSRFRVLVADDQPDILLALRLLLARNGYQVETVNSPQTVLEALASGTFDVLLMDLNYARDTTSGREGMDLLDRLAHLENLPAGQRDALLRSASLHASERLAEIESRANYVHELHDGAPGRANNGQG